MATHRRLALITVPLVLSLSAALGQVVVAQGPGGFKPAGNYNNTSMLASFNFSPSDPTQTSISLFLNRQTVVGPSGTTDETSWFLNVSTNFGFGTPNVNACGDLANAGDFNVGSNVQSASLHTTITPRRARARTRTMPELRPSTLTVLRRRSRRPIRKSFISAAPSNTRRARCRQTAATPTSERARDDRRQPPVTTTR